MKITTQTWDKEYNYLGPFCEPGQVVYYPSWGLGDIVIPCKIVEVINIYDWNDLGSLWVHKSEYGCWGYYPTEERGEGGWPICKQINDFTELQELIKDKPIRNQMYFVDEPIGHELTIGNEIFLTINEALSKIRPSKKKNLKQRLNLFRKRMSGFIKHTWEMNGEKGPEFPKYEKKKVYVRKG